MRQFVVVGHEAPTTPDFSLDDLAGGAGRLDLLCRCVLAGLLTSHGVREDAVVHLVLRDEFVVRFDGNEVRGLHPDERSTAARVRDALDARDAAVGRVPAEPSPGVEVRRGDLAVTLDDRDGPLLLLSGDGTPAVDVDPPDDAVLVLSDHREFTASERDLLADRVDRRVSLGPVPIHADHAVAVAHNWLDTDGFTTY